MTTGAQRNDLFRIEMLRNRLKKSIGRITPMNVGMCLPKERKSAHRKCIDGVVQREVLRNFNQNIETQSGRLTNIKRNKELAEKTPSFFKAHQCVKNVRKEGSLALVSHTLTTIVMVVSQGGVIGILLHQSESKSETLDHHSIRTRITGRKLDWEVNRIMHSFIRLKLMKHPFDQTSLTLTFTLKIVRRQIEKIDVRRNQIFFTRKVILGRERRSVCSMLSASCLYRSLSYTCMTTRFK